MNTEELSNHTVEKPERYCSYCGLSFRPLPLEHYLSRSCESCGKTVYTPPLSAKDGKGFTIPEGSSGHFNIAWSLDPKQGGTLTKSGVLMLVEMFLTSQEPKSMSESELYKLLDYYISFSESYLKSSPLLDGLDWDNAEHDDEMTERLVKAKDNPEEAAFRLYACSKLCKKSIKENDLFTSLLLLYRATLSHSIFTLRTNHIPEILWQGYQARNFLERVQDASKKTPAQVQAIEKIKPLFEKQSEIVLRTWVEDGHLIDLIGN